MLSLDERHDLCATRGITLNGHKATLSGAKLEFAVIRALDPDLPLMVEFSWDYAAKIVANEAGRFYTSGEVRRAVELANKQAAKKSTTTKRSSKQPTLDFSFSQLEMLITAAAHEVDWYRQSTRADKAERISELENAIKQLQQQRNSKQGWR